MRSESRRCPPRCPGVALPGGHPVAPAVGLVAEVGPALLGLDGAAIGTARVMVPIYRAKSWVEPVGYPLPDVAGRVVKSVAVGVEGVHRGGPVVAVSLRVLRREGPLPDVHTVLAAGLAFVAPGEGLALEPSPRCEFPLGFGQQALVCPGAIGPGIRPGNMDDRMITAVVKRGMRSFRMSPIRSVNLAPPRSLDHRLGGREVVRQQPCEDEGPAEPLGLGRVSGRLDEFGEVLVGDGKAVNPEGVDRHLAHRPLAVARIDPGIVAATEEPSAL